MNLSVAVCRVSGAAMHQLWQEMAHVDQGSPRGRDTFLSFLGLNVICVYIMLYRLNLEQRTRS